jgi:hypothetical protein
MTTKRGPLSQEEKDIILRSKKDAEYIAKRLKRNPESIQKFLDSLPVEKEEGISEPQQPEETLTSSAMARNKKYGAVIMTENASMISDESRKKRAEKGRSPVSSRYKNAIHVIKKVKDQ